MAHDLLVRGFDDEIHSQLGELAKEKGVSINSIVKDAVDKWLKNSNQIFQKKHYLLIYSALLRNSSFLTHLANLLW
ncbi:MAG TPA: plasmid partition protein ParG [Nitrososphaeraceae archaeon]|nr:plasmid partition protein ParG [Nitrososphaeraceae archaeon]